MSLLLHPFPSVTVTIKLFVEVGVTNVFWVAELFDQLYDVPPLADKNAVSPKQIVVSNPALAIGSGFTTTSTESVFLQPLASVAVTLYIVFTVGLTAIL